MKRPSSASWPAGTLKLANVHVAASKSGGGVDATHGQKVGTVVADLISAMRLLTDSKRAPEMERYMRNKFKCLGVAAPARKTALATFLRAPCALGRRPTTEVIAVVNQLWALPEREFQQAGCDILRSHARYANGSELLIALRRWVEQKSWWDTVDMLAMVIAEILPQPGILPQMDVWIRDSCFWVRRCALICQIKKNTETDTKRLFDYCGRCSHEKEFFIAKAVGWALRSYARIDVEAVKAFMARVPLQPLSKREALKGM